MQAPAAILAGVALLLWPAIWNGYPLLFSDTGAFLAQLLDWFMVFDKPWIYGPVLGLTSLWFSLWLPAIAQCLLVSWLLWRVAAAMRLATPLGHVALCLVLAICTATPWFTSLLMADFLAPVTVLGLFLIAFGPARGRWMMILLASFAIASHLAHLIIAAAVLAMILLLRPRAFLRATLPLVIALATLLGTNAIGHGKFGISPYGSVFMLARLTADGPVGDYLAETCPAAGYRMCAWAGRLPKDADAFMWDPEGPVWTQPGGPIGLAEEARAIVRGTILAHPVAVARAMLANTAAQLVQLQLNEVLGHYALNETVGVRLRAHFPPAELVRFQASHQFADRLAKMAAPFQAPQAVLVGASALGSLLVAWRARRRAPRLAALTVLIFAGVLANAFATGALSGPHDRYQARIAWLLFLPPMLFAYATARATSAGSDRTRAS